ncbi:MAG: DNA polymerase III subunit epsilon, partial [Pseudomonadales bacterium]|nr:DNA polymerase III subunit epsilon [Pseudomonadales bacterium]
KKHPGQKNNLDALCKRYEVDNSQRILHGALKDAEILADVYLLMTGGQSSLHLGHEAGGGDDIRGETVRKLQGPRAPLRVLPPSAEELRAHDTTLEQIQKSSGQCLWLAQDSA